MSSSLERIDVLLMNKDLGLCSTHGSATSVSHNTYLAQNALLGPFLAVNPSFFLGVHALITVFTIDANNRATALRRGVSLPNCGPIFSVLIAIIRVSISFIETALRGTESVESGRDSGLVLVELELRRGFSGPPLANCLRICRTV